MSRATATNRGLIASALAIALGAFAITALTAIAAAAAAAAERPGQRAGLKAFRGCDDLRGYLADHRRALRVYGRMPTGVALEDVDMTAVAPGAGALAENPSPTNVQEQGIDEPDIVKSDGSTIFSLDGSVIRAVDAATPAPIVLGSIRVPDGGGTDSYTERSELLLAGDRLLVLSSVYGPRGELTRLTEIDVADPTAMTATRTLVAEGAYVSARLTGSTARVVTSSYPSVPVAERGHGRALVPFARIHNRVAGETKRRRLVGCDRVSHPSRFAGAGMLSVLTIDLAEGLAAVDTDAVMTDGRIVYASSTSLYVASERWLGPGDAGARLSDVTTAIHRFDATDPRATTYVASGEVPGFMLSQWALSEHEGILRVASTTAPPWQGDEPTGESESIVTALATDGAKLRPVGSVDGLGRGETIYAVRFIGELGYVVTFRQVDPLYVLDLSDPTRPRTLGELKIPGYSAYLHPVGEGLLLGIGQDATAAGRTTGLQVSLFDVSDPSAPIRVDRESFGGGTYSEVEYDHHAFGYFAEQALAMLPLESYGAGEPIYSAIGLRITPGAGSESIGRVARIAHGTSYRAQVRRSLVIGGRVLSVSGKGVGVHDPATLAELGFAEFSAASQGE